MNKKKIRTNSEKGRKIKKIWENSTLPGFSDSNKVLPQFYDPVQPDQHDASQCQMPMSTSNFDLLSSMPLVPFHVHPYVTTFWDCLRQLSKQLSLKLSFSFVFEKRRKSVKVWTENVVGWLGKQVCSLTSFLDNNVCRGSLKKNGNKSGKPHPPLVIGQYSWKYFLILIVFMSFNNIVSLIVFRHDPLGLHANSKAFGKSTGFTMISRLLVNVAPIEDFTLKLHIDCHCSSKKGFACVTSYTSIMFVVIGVISTYLKKITRKKRYYTYF